VPYTEKDVSRDQRAAQEMVQRSGQTGVPVITIDGHVVVGFNQARLEQLIPLPARGRLGASVRPVDGGLLVGTVHAGSLAARAGLRDGDVIRTVDGFGVGTPEQIRDRLTGVLQPGRPVELAVDRNGKRVSLRLAPPVD
jgi:S1-C subfamily serine protease